MLMKKRLFQATFMTISQGVQYCLAVARKWIEEETFHNAVLIQTSDQIIWQPFYFRDDADQKGTRKKLTKMIQGMCPEATFEITTLRRRDDDGRIDLAASRVSAHTAWQMLLAVQFLEKAPDGSMQWRQVHIADSCHHEFVGDCKYQTINTTIQCPPTTFRDYLNRELEALVECCNSGLIVGNERKKSIGELADLITNYEQNGLPKDEAVLLKHSLDREITRAEWLGTMPDPELFRYAFTQMGQDAFEKWSRLEEAYGIDWIYDTYEAHGSLPSQIPMPQTWAA